MCGICGAVSSNPLSLEALVHWLMLINNRGHESAGAAIVTESGKTLRHIGPGAVREAFHADTLGLRDFAAKFQELQPRVFVGQVRYSTVGASDVYHGQPIHMDHPTFGSFFLAHNGQLPKHQELRAELEAKGQRFITESDSEVLAAFIAHTKCSSLPEAVEQVIHQIPGAYSLLALNRKHLVGARDRHGVWPLWYGEKDGCCIFSSEAPGLGHAVNGEPVLPGEMRVVNCANSQVETHTIHQPQSACCWLNAAYLSRPDESIGNSIISKARYALGQKLAYLHPMDVDVVVGIPDSGISAAEGLANTLQIPFEREGVVRNRYAQKRSFILPGNDARVSMVREKFSVTSSLVTGKRVGVCDDSVIRSNTARELTSMLKASGATEVHWRIGSPRVQHTCHYGIDMATTEELVGHGRTGSEIARLIGANSLEYLDVPGMVEVLQGFDTGWCTACVDGKYIIPVP